MEKVFFVYVIPPKAELKDGERWQKLMQTPVYLPDAKTKKPKEFNSEEEIVQFLKTDKNLDGMFADAKDIEDIKKKGVQIEERWKKKTLDVLGFEI